MPAPSGPDSPVLFAYDGSDHAKAAIDTGGRQLRTGRAAFVVTVWEPLESIPFWGVAWAPRQTHLLDEIAAEAQRTAAEGAELARAAGFDAEPVADSGRPVWARIVQAADERNAGVIVLGSHGRTGLSYVLMGSVATAVAHHAKIPVLISRMPR